MTTNEIRRTAKVDTTRIDLVIDNLKLAPRVLRWNGHEMEPQPANVGSARRRSALVDALRRLPTPFLFK